MRISAPHGIDAERILADADALLRLAAPRPAPEVPSPDAALLWHTVVRRHLDEAREWLTGQPPPKALARRPRLVRAALRALFWPMRVLAWPQRKYNQAALAALELIVEKIPPNAFARENGGAR